MQIDPLGFPMMARHEVEIINNLIREEKPRVCLEWGSGNSTAYFPKEHKCIEQWISIEHVGHYNVHLASRVDLGKVTHIWVPGNDWYIDCVKHQGRRYDFILIDGLHRDKCLRTAYQIAKEGGMILLHDAGRKEYEKFMREYSYKVLCQGEQESKGGGFDHRGLALFRA